jgi:hypothetical protein
MPYCTKCGRQVDSEDEFCGYCGKSLVSKDPESNRKTPLHHYHDKPPITHLEKPLNRKAIEPSKVIPSQPSYYNPPSTNWGILGAVVLLLCGVIAILGVFLPWMGESTDIFGVSFSANVSGWDAVQLAGIEEVPEVLLVIIGAGLMILLAVPALALAVTSDSLRNSARYFIFATSMTTLLVIGGVLWFLIEAISSDYIAFASFGVYLSGGAALIGFLFGITAHVQSQYKIVNFRPIHYP